MLLRGDQQIPVAVWLAKLDLLGLQTLDYLTTRL